ncbi:kinase-like protein [Aaosphaeria arxii CBS 175.79]|uniref:non-specific serine/threonine protein kinase n=1 Tax=Aaosphaeria arxii CBS 175.79 TaxID=1450172 RepID=A0A6A5Y568_9PLEO|nr:kinase-like protein [Aaosphaeria arxii CBS 175.79]KAF2019930.1 kinase-like protein [Aaosphaeria arxii CBS 175.79]
MAPTPQDQPAQGVRFADVHQEIEPEAALQHVSTLTGSSEKDTKQPLSPEAEQELRNLSHTIQASRCQAKRMENFSFEPVSLPASRAPSPSPASRTPSGHSALRGSIGSRPSPPASAMHSPPLTPAGTSSHDGKGGSAGDQKRGRSDPAMMTPQISPPHEPPPTSMDTVHSGSRPQSVVVDRSPKESPQPSPRHTSESDMQGVIGAHPRHPPSFSVGPAGDSLPPSRDVSPSGSTGVRTPGQYASGTTTPTYSRPFTPSGDKDDPYSRSKRPPQPKNLDALDARFIFGGRDHRRHFGNSSNMSLPRSKGTSSETSSMKDEKRAALAAAGKNQSGSGDDSDVRTGIGKQHHHGSMSELKRFFKIGGKHKDSHKHKEKRTSSPAPSILGGKSKKSGAMTPPLTQGSVSVPFADDHGLENKYGKFGKVLGSGAGGSVRLMKRSSDGVTFAVKQFRARHSYETERDYNKKVTAEFCIGSTLHHGNIIETMDLVSEKGNFYVVMEYAPFDLFAIVMTGKMSREEISCCTLQILSGVNYLHSMGLAHRDLKLDNVVVNEHGIMKIIDFGSATVFRYPFENEIVLASGIVGSDPYLAPEVYDLSKYDPQPTDVWSLAIIFCCMTLRRFPWKAPRVSDNSYKLFISPPNDGPKSITGVHPEVHSEPASRLPSESATSHHQNRKETARSDAGSDKRPTSGSGATAEKQQPQVIKGPWRLLRLLPRESRHIIGRMLELDPKKRATLEEILQDKWVTGSQICSQEEGGKIHRAENHEHTLEPGAGAAPAPATKK